MISLFLRGWREFTISCASWVFPTQYVMRPCGDCGITFDGIGRESEEDKHPCQELNGGTRKASLLLQSHLPSLQRTSFRKDFQKLRIHKQHRNKAPLIPELASPSRWPFTAKSLLWQWGGSEWQWTDQIGLWLDFLTGKKICLGTYSEDFLVSLKWGKNPPHRLEQHAWLGVPQNQRLLALEAFLSLE